MASSHSILNSSLTSRPRPLSGTMQRATVAVHFNRGQAGPSDSAGLGGAGPDSSSPTNCGVFQAHSIAHNDNYSLLDVRDAIETCAYTRGQERQECFLNFGLSADRVDKYYEPVVKMEELARDSIDEDDELAQKMVKVGGFLLFVGAVVLRRGV